MAKQERGARSNAIREYLKSHPDAGPKSIIADLKASGVNVSAALVSRIKYGKVGASGKRAGRRGRSGTQSESIRAYLMAHPNAKPKEIRLALAEQGLKVGTGLISNVKHNFMKNGGKAPSVRVAARRTAAVAVTVPQLMEVRRLAVSLGGLAQLQRAIETLEQLQ
jgi:hypothetical protein